MASKRVNESLLNNATKISRLTPITALSTSLPQDLTAFPNNEPAVIPPIPKDYAYPAVPIPDFFAQQTGGGDTIEFDESGNHSAFHNTLQEFDLTPKTPTRDLIQFLKSLATKLDRKLLELVQENKGCKAWLVVKVKYSKIDDESKLVDAFHKSQPFLFVNDFQVQDQIRSMLEQIITESAHFMREASG